MTELWVEKYRPRTLDGYVFVDDKQKNIVESWIKRGSIPNLILSGPPGTGKTTLARVLFNELNANSGDILEINASMERGIDTIRDNISRFASTMPIGKYKYILLDEADFLTVFAQMPLRNLIEKYHEFTRFILTCNYPERIDESLHSRCEGFHINQVDEDEFALRAINILLEEDIDFEADIVADYVKVTYPDLRSCIKILQSNCIDGVLKDPSSAAHSEKDYMLMAVALFKEKKYEKARKLITSKAKPADYPVIYKMLYRNLEWWSTDERLQKKAILKIAEGVRWNDNCADQEINLSATLISLEFLND